MAQQSTSSQSQMSEFESLWNESSSSVSKPVPRQQTSHQPSYQSSFRPQFRQQFQPQYHQQFQPQNRPQYEMQREPELEQALDKILLHEEPIPQFDDPLMSRPNYNPYTQDAQQKKKTQYVFETVNPYLDHQQPYDEAMQMLQNKQAHSCSDIALALEAVVQQNHSNSKAWTQLGLIQQENEKEQPAMLALEQALQLDPSDTAALMALAVSYTNEAMDNDAFRVLAQWLHHTYGDNIWDEKQPIHEVFDQLVDAFIGHARQQSSAQLQIGMGILFYNSAQYQKSIDCFSAALQETPQDYILWNRLGATMANSGESEQAIAAYHRALSLNPNFVRARYNLGVSCMNIGCHEEAALHFLQALSCQSIGLKLSNNLYESLRKTFSVLDREDLAIKCQDGVDVSVFKGEFGF